jgi:hypothetical protein
VYNDGLWVDLVRFLVTKTDRFLPNRRESAPRSYTQITMSTLSALITNAIIKVAQTNPALDREGGMTADEARIAFTDALLVELGLAPVPVAAHAPVSEPTGTPKKARKAAAPAAPKKAKKETPPAVEDADVAALTVAVAELALAAEEPKAEPKAEEPKAKKARAPKKAKEPEVKPVPASNAGAGAEPVAAEAAPEPVVAKKKPGPKPKAVKAEGPVNVEKLTPTHKKHIKQIAEELKVEPRDKEFLAYANGMSAEEWSGKPLDDHIRAFLMPEPLPLAAAPKEFDVVEFKGVEYLVDPETKFVYESTKEGTVRNHLGVVGQMEFEHMEI